MTQGLLLNRSGSDLYLWSPDDPQCPLPTVCGPRMRVHEWLEEIGEIPRGFRIVSGGTGFNFAQAIQAIDADGASLASSTTETALATTVSFLGSGSGTITGGFWSPQRTVRIKCVVAVSSLGSSPGNFNLNLRQDSTSGTSGGAQAAYALATALSASRVSLDAYLTCRVDGSSGNVESCVTYMPSATPASNPNVAQVVGANIGSFDTTGNRSLIVTGLFGTSNAANIALAKILVVEVLN